MEVYKRKGQVVMDNKIYKLELEFENEKWCARYDEEDKTIESVDEDGMKALNKLLHMLDGEKPVDAVAEVVEHPYLNEVNKRHKYAPFKITGSNFAEEGRERNWPDNFWDFGWTSSGFGFDSGFGLEQCLNECHKYGMAMEPKVEHFTLSMRLDREIKEKVFPELFKGVEEGKMKEILEDVYFKGYHRGAKDQIEHYEALTNPEYDWDKWKEDKENE